MSRLYGLLVLLALAGCKKKVAEDELPPATQSGAKTFGCLVDGKVYVPTAGDGRGRPGLRGIYEVFRGRPYLQIITVRESSGASDGEIYFTVDSCWGVGVYPIRANKNRIIYGSPFLGNCGISAFDTVTYQRGVCTITKMDLQAGVFSGKFECVIKPDNCDTIRITEGRFDLKL